MPKKRPALLDVSICIPAYNEGKNIGLILEALSNQETKRVRINHIVVVNSGSTDDTAAVVRSFQRKNPIISLISQKERKGKASAINAFLKKFHDPIIVLESADTVPLKDMVEKLCTPFLTNEQIGLTGGAPIPINDPNTFIGYVVHMWWWFHRNIPRFGEVIAFRNVLPAISKTSSVDEAFIQAKIVQLGYRAIHVDEAVVRNKGPETVTDLVKQRRRIFNGHSRLYEEEKVKIDNMTKKSLRLLLAFKNPTIKHSLWFLGGILIEIYARILGLYDAKFLKINPFIWDTATTTKNLALEEVDVQPEEVILQNGIEDLNDSIS